MRGFHLQYPALAAIVVPACLGSALRAGPEETGSIMARLGESAGKMMELPDGSRFMIGLPLEQILQVNAIGFVAAAADVETEPGSDSLTTLYWDDGEINKLDTLRSKAWRSLRKPL